MPFILIPFLLLCWAVDYNPFKFLEPRQPGAKIERFVENPQYDHCHLIDNKWRCDVSLPKNK